jgi:NIMA (never in mitosis gene a)-related kinase
MNRNRILWLLLVCSYGVTNAFKATSSSAQLSSRSARSFVEKPINFVGASTSWCSRTQHLAAVPLEVIDPSYNLALASLALGAVFVVPGSPLKSMISTFLGGIPLTLFGLFLAFQTTTLRFTFDDNNFSLVRSSGESSGENLVVGGENVWAYDKFVNYDLL